MSHEVGSPFIDEDLEQIPLEASPLETVIFQVQFPGSLSKLKQALATERVQALLSEDFPYAEKQRGVNWTVQPGQSLIQEPGPEFWNLSSADRSITASFSGESVSVVTGSYESREQFLGLVKRVLAAVQEAGQPPAVSRIGIRYIDRVLLDDPSALEWESKLSEASRGVLAGIATKEIECVALSIQQILYKWADGPQLQGKWGILPKNALIDPNVKVHDVPTWFLDIDASIEDPTDGFAFGEISTQLERLARRSYRFFRWMVPLPGLDRFRPRATVS